MKAVAVPLLLALGCGSHAPCPTTSPTSSSVLPTSTPPIGRARAGAFRCPYGEVLHFHVSYPWPNEDGGAVIEQPPRNRWSEPGIHLCGSWGGVEGAEVLACRDKDAKFDGPVEMLASDHSIVLQGYCSKGVPIGPWVTWRGDRAVVIIDGQSRGLEVHNPPPDRHDLDTHDAYEGVLVDGDRR